MKFNSNNDLIPGNFFSKTKEKELENKIEAPTQLVTFLSDKITQIESAIVTGTVTADSVTAQNVNTGTVTADSVTAQNVNTGAVDAKNIKASSLTTKTPQDSFKLVGYDENGELIPVDATLNPSNFWKLKEADENYIEPKNEKKLAGDVVNVEYENEVNTLQNIIPKLGKTKTVNNFAPDNSGNILVSWCGTKNEYEEIKDTIPDGVIVHVIGE